MAKEGNPMSQFCLGLHYAYGIVASQSWATAVEWINKSARQQFTPAEYTMGIFYKYGVGVSSNRTLADEWFRKAADQGYTAAKHEAALIADRNGNRADAVKLLREAAEKGFPSSEYLMGYVASDPVESFVWFSLAAPNVELAATRQTELRRRLSAQQLDEAQKSIQRLEEKRNAGRVGP
jgi:TPR repeat protein